MEWIEQRLRGDVVMESEVRELCLGSEAGLRGRKRGNAGCSVCRLIKRDGNALLATRQEGRLASDAVVMAGANNEESGR
jgi:hypothetical protein